VSFAERMSSGAELIEQELDRLLPQAGGPGATVAEAMRYATLGGGKRLRPVLCLAACEAGGGDPAAVLAPAAAVEMVHTYSLIHDDLPAMDDDDLRRGRPTVHRQYGEAVAILAGDALLTLAFEILASKPEGDDRAARRALAVAVVAHRAGVFGMVGGQVADMQAEHSAPDGDRLEWIHAHKTAALLSASAEIGAIHAGSSDAVRRALREYGHALGMAFQIADDVLDVTSSAEILGKTPGKDLRAGKTTWPALFGVERARLEAHRRAEIAARALDGVPSDTSFLRELARYAAERAR